MNVATLLLPARERFGGQRLSEATGRWLARAERSGFEGDPAARALDVRPRGWPVAAASRQRDVGDAGQALWLRADPAYIRPDINGARLLAYGEALALGEADAAALLQALKPLFGDAGFPLDAPHPARWYLRLPAGTRLPEFAAPEHALGADLFDQLPDGPEGRRWRTLLSEAQIALHHHPLNAQRAAAGRAPVNSLWFWGAGRLPDRVSSPYARIASDDEGLAALAHLAGARVGPLPPAWPGESAGEALFDLRAARDLAMLETAWFAPLRAAVQGGALAEARIEFADGVRYTLRAGQRWRFWRKPLRSLAAPLAGDAAE
ncbi:phosphoglycerate mutase [Vulcaniibacterium tengchongense]|uniref:Phosphoglycerate mutase n=1 Tax=Vulcaniibacterium tengchongense TaxID=1273429 RepID=A0A3N4VG01_9GAMM|nr:phosphoglycerate mutase [Vulcaniibacterium tengchongense]RPE81618.1 hypothetical protein EDC50_0810 [Vulcaniibacterium tengchongense]